ncbi:unnamed protein product [Pieris brassicae]|uniref:Uncharacterized protein n=1 Tax=Pieris brassicae TaxID=7116 RepID=A0A9P0TJB1_PIEBR|nr:unnamed protein product [Pieris brassicae]
MLAWGAGRGSAGPSLPPKKPELSDTDSEAQSALLTSAAALARRRRAVKLKRKITFKVSRSSDGGRRYANNTIKRNSNRYMTFVGAVP